MYFEEKHKSPLGYEVGDDGIDSYGVNHNGFSTRDELEYQMARQSREQQLMQNYNNQGITENYPQYGTNFWGNPDNNYGFGTSDIGGNVQNVTDRLNGTDYTTLPNYSVGSVGAYNNPGGYNSQPNYSVTPYQNQAPTNNYQQQSQTSWSNDNSISQNSYDWQNNSYKEVIPNAGSQQRSMNIENELLMDGMDVLYGMNRAVNGTTFGGLDWLGNKFGFDSQMNNYLQLKNPQERELAQTAGNIAQLGGSALSGNAIAKAGLNQANMAYNGYKIGKKYDQLIDNPYQGSGSDVIARMKNHNGEPVILQRGEAIPGENGQPIVYGKDLKRVTGTERNYGLDKGIYKHDVSRADAQRIPRIIQRKPVETNSYGQNVYLVRSKNGTFRVVTSLKDGDNIISSMYYPIR